VVFALFCSLIVAVTLIPMLASKIFKKENAEKCSGEATGKGFMGGVEKKYRKALIWSLVHRKKVILSTLAAFAVSIAMIFSLGSNFMPGMETKLIMFNMTLPAGSSLEYVDKTAKEMEVIIEEKVGDNLESMTVITGGSDSSMGGGGMSAGSNGASFIFRLKDKNRMTMGMEEIKEVIRNSVPPIKGIDMKYNDLSSSMLGAGNSAVEIKIFGSGTEELKTLGEEVVEKIKTVEGVEDVEMSLEESKPEIKIEINRERASQYGLSISQVGSYVKSFMQGQIATQLRQGDDETDIRVRFAEDYRDNLQKVKDITIATSAGDKIFLKQIADISESQGFVKIVREDQIRKVTVAANTSGRNLDAIMQDINTNLEDFEMPDGYFMENGGSYEMMQDSFVALGYAMILGIILVYMVMASQFESLLYPFIVMFEIPLSFIGVGLILFLTGQSLSLPSMIGIVVLAGIVVNNAIVFIDYINQLRKKGMEMNDAIVEAGLTRLRPILITSLTTVLGMIPLATSTQEGSEMMKPMAIAVVGGLMTSTILTLVVIPVIYSLFDRFSRKDFEAENL
ncbi:MAG: efflux RND transporter permease subunit, partial [Candidatus Pacebacteria bacterium]|nr:efflux RND transporter permease subunit [Candidatus Paceibacterota bacterium]